MEKQYMDKKDVIKIMIAYSIASVVTVGVLAYYHVFLIAGL
jgi:hypothetical protein